MTETDCKVQWGHPPPKKEVISQIDRGYIELLKIYTFSGGDLLNLFKAFQDHSSACNAGEPDSIPGSGRSPGEGKGYPLQYSGLENSMDCIVCGVIKSWTRMSEFHFHDYRLIHFIRAPFRRPPQLHSNLLPEQNILPILSIYSNTG